MFIKNKKNYLLLPIVVLGLFYGSISYAADVSMNSNVSFCWTVSGNTPIGQLSDQGCSSSFSYSGVPGGDFTISGSAPSGYQYPPALSPNSQTQSVADNGSIGWVVTWTAISPPGPGPQPATYYTLTVTVNGVGVVSDGIDSCGSNSICPKDYPSGTNVSLTASSVNGSTFASWGGACAGQPNPCVGPLSAPTSVMANFNGGGPAPVPSNLQISGVVFEDLNRNGIPDANEPRRSGEIVQLLTGPDLPPDCCNNFLRDTTTASDGSYIFNGLTAGENYRVRHVVPAGYLRTTDDSRYFTGMRINNIHNFGFALPVGGQPPPPIQPPPVLQPPTTQSLPPSGVTATGEDFTMNWRIFNPLRGDPQNIFDVIFMITNWIFNIAGTLIVILIIYSGIRFMLSRGQPGEITYAKNILFWALVGFAAVLIGKGFIYLVESILEGNFPTF